MGPPQRGWNRRRAQLAEALAIDQTAFDGVDAPPLPAGRGRIVIPGPAKSQGRQVFGVVVLHGGVQPFLFGRPGGLQHRVAEAVKGRIVHVGQGAAALAARIEIAAGAAGLHHHAPGGGAKKDQIVAVLLHAGDPGGKIGAFDLQRDTHLAEIVLDNRQQAVGALQVRTGQEVKTRFGPPGRFRIPSASVSVNPAAASRRRLSSGRWTRAGNSVRNAKAGGTKPALGTRPSAPSRLWPRRA